MARLEDRALLLGRGRFTDDAVPLEGEGVVVFLRSPHAHARIVSIDTRDAEAMPGVLAVYTGPSLAAAGVEPLPLNTGFRRAGGGAPASAERRALALDRVHFVGEAVAAVVATSREAAKDAAEAIAVDYDALPAVVDTRAALAPGAPTVAQGAPDNIAAEARHGDRAAVDAAFARATHRVALDLVHQRLAAAPLEPRSVRARIDGGRLAVDLSSQMPSGVAGTLVAVLPGLTREGVHVRVGDVGGGFGMKTGLYPEDAVVAHAARALGRAVRWQAERSEDFLSAAAGRDVLCRAELALDADGRVLALRTVAHANVGAMATGTGVAIQLLIGPWVTTSVYAIPAIDLHLQAVLTHTAPTGAYRGAGRPEAIYTIERLMDAAARAIGLDPAELRRRNLVPAERMPYTNAMAQTYDSGRFERVLDAGLALADWRGFAARRTASEAAGRLRGRAVSTFLEWTGGNAMEETVQIDVLAGDGDDGAGPSIEIVSATMPMGQGIQTSYAQVAVDVFGVPIERIRIVQGDTDRANGFGSAGSRSMFTGGGAVQVVAEKTIDEAKAMAADALEAPTADIAYAEGRFAVVGTDRAIDLFALAARQPERRIRVVDKAVAGGPTWPNGCHVAEVEIDPQTGETRVVSYASVNDIGRVISPVIAAGQVEGGAVQGIGQALGETVRYDTESGQLVTGSFMDYAMPRAEECAIAFTTRFDESTPCAHNVRGVKGVGELGTIGATPTVVNAVVDALAHAGLGRAAEALEMPATAERVWTLLGSAASAASAASASAAPRQAGSGT